MSKDRSFAKPAVWTHLEGFAERQRQRQLKRDAMKGSHCAYTAKVRAREKERLAQERALSSRPTRVVPDFLKPATPTIVLRPDGTPVRKSA